MNIFLYLLALLSLSQAANLIRWTDTHALTIGFWRLIGASAIMWAVYAWSQRKQTASIPPLSKRQKLLLFACGSCFFAHLWSYFYGVQNTSIANAMILFSLNPLFTAVLAKKWVGDSVSPEVKWSMLFGFLALALLLFPHSSQTQQSWLGGASALLSAAFYSLYVLSGKIIRKEVSNKLFMANVYLVCGSWFGIFILLTGAPTTGQSDNFWPGIAALILFPTLLGHGLFTYLVKELNINWMSCGKLIEPAVASLVAYWLFTESPSPTTWIAFAFTAIAVVLLYLPWRNNKV